MNFQRLIGPRRSSAVGGRSTKAEGAPCSGQSRAAHPRTQIVACWEIRCQAPGADQTASTLSHTLRRRPLSGTSSPPTTSATESLGGRQHSLRGRASCHQASDRGTGAICHRWFGWPVRVHRCSWVLAARVGSRPRGSSPAPWPQAPWARSQPPGTERRRTVSRIRCPCPSLGHRATSTPSALTAGSVRLLVRRSKRTAPRATSAA